jgi:hypothetical protein
MMETLAVFASIVSVLVAIASIRISWRTSQELIQMMEDQVNDMLKDHTKDD